MPSTAAPPTTKLGGWSLNRFGGFLKRSWRVNDWTWGRMDAATVLCMTVLHPIRLRRVARLTGYLTQGTPEQLARSHGGGVGHGAVRGRADPIWSRSSSEATAELEKVLDIEAPEGDLPAALPDALEPVRPSAPRAGRCPRAACDRHRDSRRQGGRRLSALPRRGVPRSPGSAALAPRRGRTTGEGATAR